MASRFVLALPAPSVVCFLPLIDADVLRMVNAGRGGQRLKLAVLEDNVLEYPQEVYGYMALYLRLMGIVPQSSERNEH